MILAADILWAINKGRTRTMHFFFKFHLSSANSTYFSFSIAFKIVLKVVQYGIEEMVNILVIYVNADTFF